MQRTVFRITGPDTLVLLQLIRVLFRYSLYITIDLVEIKAEADDIFHSIR